ncbi:type II toxin-antitoxin system PemK/MazF family toxin [Microbacterium karelineae]|uniref:type II toxin-antitoxin system PemK/MazF family toxin n=1 Tax=Microbacterium karelineae TaxID=2654283 RepID=UPI001E5A4918|nr:type II toxin-antitoxin system PemK/MazF family toxin [Microbacterium karelineae]
MANRGMWKRLLSVGIDIASSALRSPRREGGASSRSIRGGRVRRATPVAAVGTQTTELDPRDVSDVTLSYAPEPDGAPDAGEIVWTWVPYAENDGRGKDRPVLVIGRHTPDRVYAVKLTSKDKDGDREYFPLGTGPWDQRGRESWVDLDQLYSVHEDGMRREAAALDLERFTRVAHALQQRFGWRA